VAPSINVQDVKAVLLADGWHQVKEHSFSIGAYEFTGVIPDSAPPLKNWYTFEEPGGGGQLFGPMEAVLAVRTKS
jgi:hypothetical protein